jgi:hypothetical protein
MRKKIRMDNYLENVLKIAESMVDALRFLCECGDEWKQKYAWQIKETQKEVKKIREKIRLRDEQEVE